MSAFTNVNSTILEDAPSSPQLSQRPLDGEPSPKSCPSEEIPASFVPQDNIFERSLSTSPFQSLTSSRRNSRAGMVPIRRSMSVASNCSNSSCPMPYNTEDYIAPVLDSTTEILTNPEIDLHNVNIVYCDCGETLCRSPTLTKSKCLKNRPKPRSRSRLFICNSLLSALNHSPVDESESESDFKPLSEEELDPDGHTINFYSFADVLNGEQELEKFNTLRVSEYLSST